jgi:hypothetical protein
MVLIFKVYHALLKITRSDLMQNKNLGVPYEELIVDNDILRLRSIFDFAGGTEELFPFLYACEKRNCTVVFENEDITVAPDSKGIAQDVLLTFYASISKNQKIVNDYIRYIVNCSLENPNFERKVTVLNADRPILKED